MPSRLLRRLIPRLRTVDDWSVEYRRIIDARHLSKKTIMNRANNLRYISRHLGHQRLSAVRPVDVATMIRAIWDEGRATTARMVLVETRDMLNEAMLARWIDANPATAVKSLPVRVRRRRLSFEQWQAVYAWSLTRPIPWLSHMLLLALVTGQRRADLQKMRFDDVWDDHLHVVQQKTGARVALPVALRLDAAGMSIADVIAGCAEYGRAGETMLRKSTGEPLTTSSLSARFEEARDATLDLPESPWTPPSLHECRSLSERLYRAQGIDTKTLLGHRRQIMTDKYNDDRGLSQNDYKYLVL